MTRNLGKTFIMVHKHSWEPPVEGGMLSNILFKCFRMHAGNIRCIDLYSTFQGKFAFLWLLNKIGETLKKTNTTADGP